MKVAVLIRRNADGTATVRAGGYTEHVEIASKGPLERYEAIRWALITAGLSFDPDEVADIVRRELHA